jgi:dTDP-glucose 4,6-dehydratase
MGSGREPKVSRAERLRITYDYFKGLSAEELNEKEHFSYEGYVRK